MESNYIYTDFLGEAPWERITLGYAYARLT